MPIRRPGKTRCAGAGLAPGRLRCRFAPQVCESVALPRSPASRRILDQMFGLIANTVKRKNQPTTKEKDKEAPPIRHVNRLHRTGWCSCGIDYGSSLAFPTQLTNKLGINRMIGIAWQAWPNLPLFGDASDPNFLSQFISIPLVRCTGRSHPPTGRAGASRGHGDHIPSPFVFACPLIRSNVAAPLAPSVPRRKMWNGLQSPRRCYTGGTMVRCLFYSLSPTVHGRHGR